MAGRDVLKEVLLQMQNLKLSSPLRTDQGKDDNKENIHEGQDLKIADGKNLDPPVLTQGFNNTEKQIGDIDVNCQLDGFSPGPLKSSILNVIQSEDTVNTECLLEDNDTTVVYGVNSSSLNKSEQLLSNPEQKTSTQSLYDDCIDALENQTEDQDKNNADLVKNVLDDLNSTYAIEKQPLGQTSISSNSCETTVELNSTQVFAELNTTIVKDDELPVDTTFCEEKLPRGNVNDSDKVATCDQTFIDLSQSNQETVVEKETITGDSFELRTEQQEAKKETTVLASVNLNEKTIAPLEIIQQNFSNPLELESSLVASTTNNSSIEDLEKSTATLVSDSSDRSLASQLSESINCSSENQEVTEQLPCTDSSFTSNNSEVTEKLNISTLISTNQLEQSSKNLKTLSEVSSSNISSLDIVGQTSDEIEKNSDQNQSSLVGENVEDINTTTPVIVNSEAKNVVNEDVQSSLAFKTLNTEVNKNPEEDLSAEKMEEMNTKLQQEFSDIKLELNAVQQAKAILELEVSKKDEIILKTEAESMKKEQQYLQEIKTLQEQLKEKEKKENSINEKDSKHSSKDIEEALKDAKAKEHDFIKVLEEYEKTIAARFSDYKKLQEEYAAVNRHLSNLELSFSDLLTKYEKAKTVISGYKRNEDKLKEALTKNEDTFKQQEGRYESLKAHAQSQFDKGNLEFTQFKEKSESEITKLKAIVKRLEIKNGALETSLAQKTKECLELAALCDEVTGNKKF